MAGVMGVAGESHALQRCDLAVDSSSIGSGGGVLSLALEAYSLAWLKASQRYLALGEFEAVCMLYCRVGVCA